MVAGIASFVFFARNPESSKKTGFGVVVTDKVTNTCTIYPSVNIACKQAFGLKIGNSGFIKNHIIGDKLYKNRYALCYSNEYRGPTPVIWKKKNKLSDNK